MVDALELLRVGVLFEAFFAVLPKGGIEGLISFGFDRDGDRSSCASALDQEVMVSWARVRIEVRLLFRDGSVKREIVNLVEHGDHLG
ncbi:MAG: hypothetical protein LC777_12900 [Actinobacteria bacterium]|nr:hypothetical protein [Actinomycetota bacterium]